MKNKPIFIAILSSILLSISLSCERNTYADPLNNIELTDFTKALISLYLRDSIVQGDMHYYNEITLINHSLDTVSYLSLWANDREQYKRDCYESYVGEGVEYRGKTTYSGYSIRVFGAEDSRFFLLAQTRPNKAVVLSIVMNTILWSCSYVSIWITPYIRTGLFSSH